MKYNKLTPFKWCIANNFPFIEADFDAITNYQLFSKVVEYLNKTIDTTNELGLEVERFSNYFDNLNVQEEINNKLDEMAESGELQEIIISYLNANGLLCYNTINDLKNADNIINGSFAKTFGKNIYNDGYGEFYKIRNIKNTDIVDNINIISLNNSNTLIAELIQNATIESLLNIQNDLISTVNKLNSRYNACGLSAHISFDDVEFCFTNIQNNNYNSIFDEPFLKKLKDLHDRFNACFSLYVYTEKFNAITKTQYKEEFKKCSNWLKIGYHGINASTNFANDNYLSAKTKYNTFVDNVIRICGTNRIIDRVPRLSNYVAPSQMINGIIDAKCGVIGLLDADDDKLSYNHNQNIVNYLKEQFEYFDNISQLFFIRTNIRIENESNLTNALENILNTSNSTNRNIEIFTHEWHMYDGTTLSNIDKLETICNWLKNNDIPYNFVENKLPNMTGNRLIKPFTKTSFMRNGSGSVILGKNNIMDNVSYNHLRLGTSLNAGGGFFILENRTRMGCEAVLIAPANKTIEIHSAIDNLQYGLAEYTDFITDGVNFTPNGESGNRWIDCGSGTTTVTLQNDTKCYLIAFKKADDSEFTDNDVLFNNVYVIYGQ